ncbi:U4/U6.U5 tri-snRNP-associated protein 1-like [Sinocyclocheilus grahami]|uniref:U4/U6.U5 tri-snRNP-associated protein 1-like n=1 Tax=Sinocyclocheilus grahami TaxID=75366 RepID=UPI0007AC994F|nr:PREDICTED: U4/U6.U5 tri-snRNP-associated protein 1-like [Sinocyclocheilus grahami]
MGSSKKHKEKEKDRDPEDRHREHKKHRHKDRDKEKDREREKRKRSRSRERGSRGAEKDRSGKAERSNAEPRVKKEKPDPAFEDKSEPGPKSASGDASLSIEETNKLRAKLGLKPLELNVNKKGKNLMVMLHQSAIYHYTLPFKSLVAEHINQLVKAEDDDNDPDKKNNIVFNATSEFCRTLGDIPTYGLSGNREDQEDIMDFEKDDEKEGGGQSDSDMDDNVGWSTVNLDEEKTQADFSTTSTTILDEEPIVNSGLAAALLLCKNKGLLDTQMLKVARVKASKGALPNDNYCIEDKICIDVFQVAEHMNQLVKAEDDDNDPDKKNNIVFNATSEFCRTLGDIPTYGLSGNREDQEDIMDFEKDDEKEGGGQSDSDMDDNVGWSTVNLDEEKTQADFSTTSTTILDEEPIVNSGLAAALLLCKNKGLLDTQMLKVARVKASKGALPNDNYCIEDKMNIDDKYSRREEYRGFTQDFKEKDNYKPEIKIEYVDESGRKLTPKEAFRQLSHRFHGKGSGKMKTERRMKKLEEEALLKKMSSSDTPLGTVALLQEKQKSQKTPYIVLSGSGKSMNANTITK